MKAAMEKIDIIVKLKEKIVDARAHNDTLATQLQKLLDAITKDTKGTPAI